MTNKEACAELGLALNQLSNLRAIYCSKGSGIRPSTRHHLATLLESVGARIEVVRAALVCGVQSP